MFKIRKNISILLVKFILPFMNRLTLKTSGWKREVQVHRTLGFNVARIILWKDPNNENAKYAENEALRQCKNRIT